MLENNIGKLFKEMPQTPHPTPPPSPRFKLHCKMIQFSVLLLTNEILKRYNELFKLQLYLLTLQLLTSSMRGRKTLRFLSVVTTEARLGHDLADFRSIRIRLLHMQDTYTPSY